MSVIDYQIQRLKEIGVDGPARGSEKSIIRRSEIYKQKQKLEQGSVRDKWLEIFDKLEKSEIKSVSEEIEYIEKYCAHFHESFPITFTGDIINTVKECLANDEPIESKLGVDY